METNKWSLFWQTHDGLLYTELLWAAIFVSVLRQISRLFSMENDDIANGAFLSICQNANLIGLVSFEYHLTRFPLVKLDTNKG